jgi:hypothetical protein
MKHNAEQSNNEILVYHNRKIPWSRIMGTLGVFAAIVALMAAFYLFTYHGLQSRESIDIAQIARNVSEGKGYTTRFVRPFNIPFYTRYQNYYPELNHSPAFPYAVSLLYRLRSLSEQVVVWTSLFFTILTMAATYLLGRMLFGWKAGLLSAVAFGTSMAVLKAATAGEEWTLASFLFTLLLIVIVLHHKTLESKDVRLSIVYAGLSAVLLAGLYMTNPVLAVLVIPIATYYAVTGTSKRLQFVVFVVAAIVLIAPWAIRNAHFTGVPILGGNAWDIASHTTYFPGDTVYRSADSVIHEPARIASFPVVNFPSFAQKLMTGTRDTTGNLAGCLGWIVLPFAIVSFLYKFKQSSANAIRGLIYGILPLTAVFFGLYSLGSGAVVILAPVISVFGCAYFLLLLDAKKLHSFFTRSIIAGFVLICVYPALTTAVWGVNGDTQVQTNKVEGIFSNPQFINDVAAHVPVYTDQPWLAAWRTTGVAVWLPLSDGDVEMLSTEGLPMHVIVLTPESDTYTDDDMWKMLHQSEIWRQYIADPKEGLKEFIAALPTRISSRLTEPDKDIERFSRRFKLSDSIKGFVALKGVRDPLGPDDIQILVRKKSQ